MAEKIYLCLLILCGISCQEIIAKLSGDNIKESSDLLVRKRRVINHLPGGSAPTPIEKANYMVQIKLFNRAHCAGVILSHYTILTAAECVKASNITNFIILSGSGHTHRSQNHTVISKEVYYGNPPHNSYDGIALMTANPPFVFNKNTGYIQLYEGPLPTGKLVTVFGWGCSYPPQPAPANLDRRLRSIHLPILDHGECANIYRSNLQITEKHLCTYDLHQYCARTDAGGPLVVNNRLAGVYVFKGEVKNRMNPDVFVNLQHANYRIWIIENTLLM